MNGSNCSQARGSGVPLCSKSGLLQYDGVVPLLKLFDGVECVSKIRNRQDERQVGSHSNLESDICWNRKNVIDPTLGQINQVHQHGDRKGKLEENDCPSQVKGAGLDVTHIEDAINRWRQCSGELIVSSANWQGGPTWFRMDLPVVIGWRAVAIVANVPLNVAILQGQIFRPVSSR